MRRKAHGRQNPAYGLPAQNSSKGLFLFVVGEVLREYPHSVITFQPRALSFRIFFSSLRRSGEEYLPKEEIQAAFLEFVEQMKAIRISPNNADIYIGWWGSQATFEIPHPFLEFAAVAKIPVTLDIND
jgi:hypothetical protein